MQSWLVYKFKLRRLQPSFLYSKHFKSADYHMSLREAQRHGNLEAESKEPSFTLGQLIIEHNKLSELRIDYENLPSIIEVELADA